MIPDSATPMGSPMARTEPNATTRITMAKARPSASDSGSSNSPKAAPPSSTCTPSISGKSSWSGAAIGRGVGPVGARDLERGEGDLAGLGALGGDLRLRGRLVGADEGHPLPRLEVGGLERGALLVAEPVEGVEVDVGVGGDRLDGGEELRHLRLDLGVVDALARRGTRSCRGCRRRSHRSPRSSTSRPWVLSKPDGVKSCPKAPPIALEDDAERRRRRRPTR